MGPTGLPVLGRGAVPCLGRRLRAVHAGVPIPRGGRRPRVGEGEGARQPDLVRVRARHQQADDRVRVDAHRQHVVRHDLRLHLRGRGHRRVQLVRHEPDPGHDVGRLRRVGAADGLSAGREALLRPSGGRHHGDRLLLDRVRPLAPVPVRQLRVPARHVVGHRDLDEALRRAGDADRHVPRRRDRCRAEHLRGEPPAEAVRVHDLHPRRHERRAVRGHRQVHQEEHAAGTAFLRRGARAQCAVARLTRFKS
mmetsp:Transcript_77916/g.218378  ORF Transcript_77916/g.218378 Transcript_77916/m.218378 type:complete len:251 (-) Transcript_77916:90-842(-)